LLYCNYIIIIIIVYSRCVSQSISSGPAGVIVYGRNANDSFGAESGAGGGGDAEWRKNYNDNNDGGGGGMIQIESGMPNKSKNSISV